MMEREPKSLYQLAIRRIADQNVPGDIVLRKHKNELTVEMIFDICAELNERLSRSKKAGKSLGMFMSNLDIFLEFLQLGHKRMTLHKIFESINSLESHDKKLSQVLTEIFVERLQDSSLQYPSCVHVGLNFASFLSASGWYEEAIDVLRALNESFSNVFPVETQVSLNFRLLHAFSEYRRFDMAEKVLQKLSQMADNQMFKITPQQMCEISNYYYWRSLYPDAHSWSMRAVRKITAMTPSRMIIDVLRQAGRSSVVRRLFPLAQLLLGEALLYCQEIFGKEHLKYADCLSDYAFYLLNVDEVGKSVQAYEEVLLIRENILGHQNVLVAKVYEELAYATYVHEYSSGHFEKAKKHAEGALVIMKDLLPTNHLLVASAQRVLALILEEIAIDLNVRDLSKSMLNQAEELHLSAVNLSTQAFGETNVQTAKHYGNLGRLYQTMERYNEAEKMHLKAIGIKETLLGGDDYEVALSIGHLASLYNYDLDQFEKAEELYLRSIRIALRLFGPGYSGLEYDYRGLIRVYEETEDWNNVYKYIYLLRDWKELKRARENQESEEILGALNKSARSISSILSMIDINENVTNQNDADLSHNNLSAIK